MVFLMCVRERVRGRKKKGIERGKIFSFRSLSFFFSLSLSSRVLSFFFIFFFRSFGATQFPALSVSQTMRTRVTMASAPSLACRATGAGTSRSKSSSKNNVVVFLHRRNRCRRFPSRVDDDDNRGLFVVSGSGIPGSSSSSPSPRRLAVVPRAAGKSSTSSSSSSSSDKTSKDSLSPPPATAEEAITRGLAAFHERKDPAAALALFDLALSASSPSSSPFPAPLTEDEARAATYNRACALAALSRWDEAAEAVLDAVNEKGLKLDVAANDPDLRRLRERREWIDLLEEAKGGVTAGAVVRARAEAKSPFRGLRLFLFGGLGAGAGLGLLIIVARVVQAARGGDGAPDLDESLRNLAINSAAVAAFSYLFARDFKGSARDRAAAEAEESLSKLELRLRDGRVVPLANFRGKARPVLVSGPRAAVAKALKAAAPFREELIERGVRFVGVETDAADPDGALRALKAELRNNGASDGGSGASGSGASGSGFGPSPSSPSSTSSSSATDQKPYNTLSRQEKQRQLEKQREKQLRDWQLAPANASEWRAWLDSAAARAGLPGTSFWVQVQLDGSVRSSGSGAPRWDSVVRDLAPLDSLMTKLTDGVAR